MYMDFMPAQGRYRFDSLKIIAYGPEILWTAALALASAWAGIWLGLGWRGPQISAEFSVANGATRMTSLSHAGGWRPAAPSCCRDGGGGCHAPAAPWPAMNPSATIGCTLANGRGDRGAFCRAGTCSCQLPGDPRVSTPGS